MLIITILVLLVPSLIGVLCFERFRAVTLDLQAKIELYLIFALFSNLAAYAVFMFRGWRQVSWELNANSSMIMTSVMVQYTLISIIASVVIAYILSLVRITKSRKDEEDTDAIKKAEEDELQGRSGQ